MRGRPGGAVKGRGGGRVGEGAGEGTAGGLAGARVDGMAGGRENLQSVRLEAQAAQPHPPAGAFLGEAAGTVPLVLACRMPQPTAQCARRFVFLMMLAICAAFLVPFTLCSRTAHEDPTPNHGHDLATEESVVVAAPAAGRQGRGRVKIAPLPAGPSSAGVQLSGGPVVGATGRAVLF